MISAKETNTSAKLSIMYTVRPQQASFFIPRLLRYANLDANVHRCVSDCRVVSQMHKPFHQPFVSRTFPSMSRLICLQQDDIVSLLIIGKMLTFGIVMRCGASAAIELNPLIGEASPLEQLALAAGGMVVTDVQILRW